MIRIEHIDQPDLFFKCLDELKSGLYPENVLPHTLSADSDPDFVIDSLIAREDGELIASLRMYDNPGVKYKGLKTIQIGNYECIDSANVAQVILQNAFEFGKKMGYDYVIGPMNGSTWFNYRFKLKPDHPNFFLEAFHQAYYGQQFQENGFETISSYISAIDYKMNFRSEKLDRVENNLLGKGVVFRFLDINKVEGELKQIHHLSINAFNKNAFFTSLSWNKFWQKNKPIASQIDPNLFLIAEHNGEIVAFLFAIKDFLNPSKKRVVLKTLAVKQGHEYLGTGFVLLNKLNAYLRQNNYESIIHAYMFEDNTVIRMSGKYSHELYSRYSLFGKKL